MFRSALRMAGYNVRTAAGGFSALSQVQQEVPDAIVLDLDLPDVNGLALQKELASNPATERVPIIVVTGTDWHPEMPSFATLRKPITGDTLIQALRGALSQAI